MIKKIILPLIAILLLSSCANKFSIQKRKYTKGYYFATSKNNSSKSNNAEVVKHSKAKNLDCKTIALSNANENEIITAPISIVADRYSKIVLNKKAETNKHTVASISNKKITETKNFKPVVLNSKKSNLSTSAKKGDSDANLILLVILSIFPILALIAMYIHDGHKITTNFWLDLILHITIIGYMIFALLVVFNVVDLS